MFRDFSKLYMGPLHVKVTLYKHFGRKVSYLDGSKRFYNVNSGNIKSNQFERGVVLSANDKKGYVFEQVVAARSSDRFTDGNLGVGKEELYMAARHPVQNGEYITIGRQARNREYIFNDVNEFVLADGGEQTEVGKDVTNGVQTNWEVVNQREDDDMKLEKLLRKRNIKKDIVTITKEAKLELKKIVEDNDKQKKNSNYVLKLFFITKGCNGLTHSFTFVHRNDIHKNDEIIYDYDDSGKQNVLLVIDNKCILYVINTTLDYYKDDLTEKFIFTNPNIASVCPCGTSFHFSKRT
ncbi:iron-sulfur assembly protein, putative [Plasmodium ovale wallikeri]|uniref:Iron-sulfur assembly protein, putative n=2 Tax=Plasmodium ovale TaxID=36330 RepID=A0A1A8YRV4_PLAOA|nr:iron-sulfur assembly protein, putative [Plasmodium ovale wallikeri]SBT34703.1 iron-sulfur assembly protein, putative [Plasmodium ovale wallikeri]SBT76743.1 iron-sulfur assembly protein, putative [Plasmodium ovale]